MRRLPLVRRGGRSTGCPFSTSTSCGWGRSSSRYRPDVPIAVAIDEAVELAKRFSTDDSGKFVNGVLSALVADLRQ